MLKRPLAGADWRDRFGVPMAGLAAERQRSLAATVQWSYAQSTERKRRVFADCRHVRDVQPRRDRGGRQGRHRQPVARLVDCSLLTPPPG